MIDFPLYPPDPSEPVQNGHGNHLPDGKFAPGNKAAKGHGPRKMQELRGAFLQKMTGDHVDQLFDKLFSLATEDGDVQAARTLLAYGLGQPHQQIALEATIAEPEMLPHERRAAAAMLLAMAKEHAADMQPAIDPSTGWPRNQNEQ